MKIYQKWKVTVHTPYSTTPYGDMCGTEEYTMIGLSKEEVKERFRKLEPFTPLWEGAEQEITVKFFEDVIL